MKKIIICCFILAGLVLPAFAKTMYTSDITAINVRQGNETKFPIIATLKSGQQVTVLESAQGWTKIQLPDGKQGWLITSYLTDEKPADSQPLPLNKKTEEIQQQLNAALKENEALKKENEALKSQLQDSMKKLSYTNVANAPNPKDSEEFLSLKAKFDQLSAEAAEKQKKIEELNRQPAGAGGMKEQNKYYLYMFLAGAGVLILGMMIGASSKRRRSSLL